MKRHFKRFLYLVLFFAFWGGVGFGVYSLFFVAPPSCFDNRQNQGEEGVDCGGICKRFCLPPDVLPVTASNAAQVFRPIPELAITYVEITNPNQEVGTKNLGYTLKLRGSQGGDQEIAGTTYIYPGEAKSLVLIESARDFSGTVNASLELATSSIQYLPRALFEKPQLRVRDSVTTMTQEDGIRVVGTVVNDDPLTLSEVTVIALFYDGQRVLRGVSQTVIPQITAGVSESFSIAYPAIAIDPGSTRLIVTGERP